MIASLILAATITVNSSSTHGDAYVFTRGETRVSLSNEGISLDRALAMRKQLGHDFLWVRRDGRAYVIRDRDFLDRIDGLYAEQRELRPEQKKISRQESDLDEQIDALEDRDEDDAPLTAAEETKLRDLRARMREVSARERELDRREEELDRIAERQLWRLVDEAIRNGKAVRE